MSDDTGNRGLALLVRSESLSRDLALCQLVWQNERGRQLALSNFLLQGACTTYSRCLKERPACSLPRHRGGLQLRLENQFSGQWTRDQVLAQRPRARFNRGLHQVTQGVLAGHRTTLQPCSWNV